MTSQPPIKNGNHCSSSSESFHETKLPPSVSMSLSSYPQIPPSTRPPPKIIPQNLMMMNIHESKKIVTDLKKVPLPKIDELKIKFQNFDQTKRTKQNVYCNGSGSGTGGGGGGCG